MDPGAIVGIISLGIQVADGLVKYYTAYKDRESDTAHTVKRLIHLLNILGILRNNLVCRKFQPDEKSLLEAIERSVGDCEDLIHELQEETDKFTKAPSAGVAAGVRVTGRRLAYPFRQSTLQKLDEDIDEICANLTLALQVLQQQDLGSVQDEIQDTKALLELVRADQISAEIRDWLKAPDASINYNEACKKKYPGTGLWFIKSPQFSTWLQTANSFLWLKGFAGCGKSVLSSTIIQHTLRHRRSNPRVGIAFFYFTFNDDAKQDTSAMLRALILQLVPQLQSKDALPRLHQNYRGGTPPDQALLDCLHQLIAQFDDVYIVLDALDESPRHKHREDLLRALDEMRGWQGPELHLLVTSRDEQDIREELGPAEDQMVAMGDGLVDADIAAFVAGHLRDNRRLRKWERFHGQIEKALTEGAKGVFRWVECQFAALEACPGSKTRLDALLGSLPRTLDKTYERMLHNIEEESVDDAKRILTLLCIAKRPLQVEELIDGIAVELGDDAKFNEDSRLMNQDDIRHICPGFIEVDFNKEDKEVTVRIAHYSVQEYLESDRILTSGTASFSVRRREANTEVASICLVYLMDPELSEACINQTWGFGFAAMYPLATYAAANWAEHYREGDGLDPALHRLALDLFHDDEGTLVSWANIYKWTGYKRDGLGDRILSPLYLAARLGLDPIVRVLADEFGPTPPRKHYFESALIAAATSGHASTVALLLDHGASINHLGFEGTALHLAARHGHLAVAQTLLSRGADLEACDYRGKSPIYDAAAGGKDEIVRLFLVRGADIDPAPGGYDTPLECAARGGRHAVVAMLLDRGADPNRGRYARPLEAAREYPAVVRLLLDRGADIDLGTPAAPLALACSEGVVGVVEVLLDRGADVERAGGFARLLERAVANSDARVVKLLLERGADANGGEGADQKPLEAAAALRAAAPVFEHLLDAGADINGGLVMTPLEKAVTKTSVANVKLLLERGADPNLGIQMTPLEAAANGVTEIIMDLLIENGADVNKGIQMTPLETLMQKPVIQFRLVELLVEMGADVSRELKNNLAEAAKSEGSDSESIIALLSEETEVESIERVGTIGVPQAPMIVTGPTGAILHVAAADK
ncbi:ankyrin repeat-containing domain protein [Chaetomium fimeti]|uniref:Ankyrin repeat-containing domain protein n=1 Tax=Chaetomium fimeti TaxID=1854472 RepID=A0AAE0LWN4_9PEZI|nr:ankyrin repeat-containing domain protein [Chaetomium fimeti]